MRLIVKAQLGREHKVYEYLFDKPLVSIGRVPENEIQLPLTTISGFHAQIITEENEQFLMDRGSVNGTYLNGRRLAGGEKKRLIEGDVIRIQNFEIEYWKSSVAQQDPEATVAVTKQMVADVMGSTDAIEADSQQITKSKDYVESKIVTGGGLEQKPAAPKPSYIWWILAALAAIGLVAFLLL
jgi:pSer/pThr/pTyr-binding forkhead associated (FHA) protein